MEASAAARTVLLVDDTPLVLAMYGRYLSAEGYDVRTAESGRAALAQLASVQPALIIVDGMMPQMSGHELLAQIRARAETAATPVIFLTAAGREDGAVARAYALGADAYLEKPIPRGEFLAKVRELIG